MYTMAARQDSVSGSPVFIESEDDNSSLSSASPMSVSSVEACSPYSADETGLDDHHEDAAPNANHSDRLAFNSSISSSSSSSSSSTTCPSPLSSPCPSSSASILDDNSRWSERPYRPFNGAKSVRWFRDDRGLWSEQTQRRRASSPYQRSGGNVRGVHNAAADNNNKQASDALIEAVRRQDLSEIRNLIAKNATQLNVLGQEGDSPLHRSCRLGNLETVKLLVRHGADPELANREGWSPLHLAVDSGYQDVVLYLLSLSRR